MSEHPATDDRLLRLAEAVCEKTASSEELAELDSLLLADEASCYRYLSYCRMHVGLKMDMLSHEAAKNACKRIDMELADTAAMASDISCGQISSGIPLNLLSTTFHSTVGFFSQEIPFSLLIATVVTGLGLWIGSIIFVTHHKQIADNNQPPRPTVAMPQAEYIGRITGMVDVQWADATTAAVTDLVTLGRKYAIASGMMEITYNTGAKVILQGPATYEAESRDSGFLSLGKVTARLEKKGAEVRGQRSGKVVSGQWPVTSKEGAVVRGQGAEAANHKSEIINHKSLVPSPQPALTLALSQMERGPDTNPKSQIAKSQISNPQSPIPNPSLSTIHNSLFTINTPTATVTDLGTEFTVEVRPDRSSEIYVIQGIVEASRDSRTGGKPIRERLTAGEGICFLDLDQPPRRTASHTKTSVHLSPTATNVVRRVYNARTAKTILQPTNIVASAYHAVWNADGRRAAENDRHLAFDVATDGIYGRGEKNEERKSSFDAYQGSGFRGQGSEKLATSHQPLATSFVGLLYSNKKTRFDRIKVFLARQTAEGGSWAEPPRLFILKKPVDTNQTRPEDDPDNWQELPYQPLYGAFSPKVSPGPGAVIELALTGSSAEDRTGYGWALGGVPGNGSQAYVSVTELRAYSSPLLEEDSKQEQENKSSGQNP